MQTRTLTSAASAVGLVVTTAVVAALATAAAAAAPPKTMTRVTPAGTRHEMVLVPAGEFSMGSTTGAPDEKPVHPVYLDSFYIDRVPVTNAAFLAFLRDVGRNETEDGARYLDLGDPDAQIVARGDSLELADLDLARRPVVEVSWYGADAYCAWAGLRLPTEAEWEKAARGTDSRTYPWGEGIDSTLANYGDLEGETEDVGSHPQAASPYGVLDMAGNVRNWVADYYESEYYTNSPRLNPHGPNWTQDRAMRGGGFLHADTEQRCTFRLGGYPSFTDGAVGFRCACAAIPAPEQTPTDR